MLIDAYCARATANVGDKFCDPTLYFDFGLEVRKLDIRDPDKKSDVNVAICGGGGMWIDTIKPCVIGILRKYPNGTILWGIGLNNGGKKIHTDCWPDWGPAARHPGSGHTAPKPLPVLVGARDWKQKYPWVPCASCMHGAFDLDYTPPEHQFAIYDHYEHPVPVTADQLGKLDVPRRNNRSEEIEPVIKFLANAKTILTSSYHGVYWALLLGKHVIAYAWSTKFLHMRHPPGAIVPFWNVAKGQRVLGDEEAWKRTSAALNSRSFWRSQADPDILQQYRQANMDFADKVNLYLRSREGKRA